MRRLVRSDRVNYTNPANGVRPVRESHHGCFWERLADSPNPCSACAAELAILENDETHYREIWERSKQPLRLSRRVETTTVMPKHRKSSSFRRLGLRLQGKGTFVWCAAYVRWNRRCATVFFRVPTMRKTRERGALGMLFTV
jgi:hypothetical protein